MNESDSNPVYKKMILRSVGFVDFLTKILGNEYEVVLYELYPLSDNELCGTIIAITNGYISGRKCGDSLLDAEKKLLASHAYDYTSCVTNYQAHAENGRHMLCSTYFLSKVDDKIPDGIISVNKLFSVTGMTVLKENTSADFINISPQKPQLEPAEFSASIPTLVDIAVREITNSELIDAKRLVAEERMEVVDNLKRRGVFQLRNSVSEVAARLGISEPTVYRYLSKKE